MTTAKGSLEEQRRAEQEAHYDERPELPAIGAYELEQCDALAAFEAALRAWQPQEAIAAVLRQVHGQLGLTIGGLAMRVMADLARDVLRSLVEGCAEIAEKTTEERDHGTELESSSTTAVTTATTTTSGGAEEKPLVLRELETAVRIRFGGELGIYSIREARKAHDTGPVFRPEYMAPVLRAHSLFHEAEEERVRVASVFLCGAVEYIVAEVLEIAGNKRQEDTKTQPEKQVTTRHIMLCIKNDEELNRMFIKAIFPEAGVIPYISTVFRPYRDGTMDEEEEEEVKQATKGKEDEKEPEEDKEEGDDDEEVGDVGDSDADAIAEMQSVQAHGAPLITDEQFSEFAKGIVAEMPEMKGIEVSDSALAALHIASEDYLVSMFRCSCLG
jgi:histone H2A